MRWARPRSRRAFTHLLTVLSPVSSKKFRDGPDAFWTAPPPALSAANRPLPCFLLPAQYGYVWVLSKLNKRVLLSSVASPADFNDMRLMDAAPDPGTRATFCPATLGMHAFGMMGSEIANPAFCPAKKTQVASHPKRDSIPRLLPWPPRTAPATSCLSTRQIRSRRLLHFNPT
jgi:hypothetical protein